MKTAITTCPGSVAKREIGKKAITCRHRAKCLQEQKTIRKGSVYYIIHKPLYIHINLNHNTPALFMTLINSSLEITPSLL